MTDNDPDPTPLADLNTATIRRENDHVDNEMSSLEDKVEDLQQDLADVRSERDDYEERAKKSEKLLEQFRDSQRDEQLARIREANAAVDPDEEVDLATLEDASVDQLDTIASMLEKAAETTGTVSNTNNKPDLGSADSGKDQPAERLDEIAAEMGLSKSWEKTKTGDGFGSPQAAGGRDEAGPSAADVLEELSARQSGNAAFGGEN